MNKEEKISDQIQMVPGVGMMADEIKISNSAVYIDGVFATDLGVNPEMVIVKVYVGALPPCYITVPPEELNFYGLRRRMPTMSCNFRPIFDGYLNEELQACLERSHHGGSEVQSGEVMLGRLFKESGLHRLEGNTLCAVEGDSVIGCGSGNYYIAPDIAKFTIRGEVKNPLETLFSILMEQVPAVFLTVAFTLLSLVRSTVMEAGVDLQAVLYLAGPQGVGKTTLAQRAAGFVVNKSDPRGGPALFYGAGGTWAAIRDAMASHRDLPLIVDDLCLSASRKAVRERQHLAAQAVREAANAAKIVKKGKNGEQIEIECKAGVILTAEFSLENASDLTRCVIARVKEPLNLPPEFSAELMGSIAKLYVKYFLDHADSAIDRLKEDLAKADVAALEDCEEARVRTNLLVLRWAFSNLFYMAAEQGADLTLQKKLLDMFDDALIDAVDAVNSELRTVRSTVPEGNLAFVLLKAIESKEFRLIKNREKLYKLPKRDGIIFQGDICLRAAPLETFVRRQNGFRSWKLGDITTELKRYGALCIQEEGTCQVKLSKEKGIPRVYRIRKDALQEFAEMY